MSAPFDYAVYIEATSQLAQYFTVNNYKRYAYLFFYSIKKHLKGAFLLRFISAFIWLY